MTATEVLRRMLDERGVEWTVPDEVWNQDRITYWQVGSIKWVAFESENCTLWLNCNSVTDLTPEQAIAATLGRESWVNPTWERWHKSLRHDEIKSIGDAVEQLMYEAIEFGGDMGPNGNTYNGIDEGDVLTAGFINEWVARFESMLEIGTCKAIISDNLNESEGMGDAWADCSACGHLLFVLTDPSSETPNFCPNCGRKVVDDG